MFSLHASLEEKTQQRAFTFPLAVINFCSSNSWSLFCALLHQLIYLNRYLFARSFFLSDKKMAYFLSLGGGCFPFLLPSILIEPLLEFLSVVALLNDLCGAFFLHQSQSHPFLQWRQSGILSPESERNIINLSQGHSLGLILQTIY